MLGYSFITTLGLALAVSAKVHHLYVGTFAGTSSLYTLEFDDETYSLDVVANTTAYSNSPWIALDNKKQNLLAASWSSPGAYASYSVNNSSKALTLTSVVDAGGNCSSSNPIFIVQSPAAPYGIYSTTFGACGNVLTPSSSLNTSMSLTMAQDIYYSTSSGVHGLALHPSGKFIYAADDSANQIWTHSVDSTTGLLTLVGTTAAPSTGSDPRHVAVSTNGAYLYSVFEGTNEVGVFTISNSTGLPVYQNVTYPLILSNETSSSYWSDEVKLSSSGSYLWATSRSRETSSPGYISAFSLSSTGRIEKQLFLTATTSSGGAANAVSPSGFSDEFVAITDAATGFVEVYKFDGESAEVVAHRDIVDGGCCANAVWLD